MHTLATQLTMVIWKFTNCEMAEVLENRNPRKNDSWTPLHLAAHGGHLEICKLICQDNIDKNPLNENGQSPIDVANASGNMEIVSFLKVVKIWIRAQYFLGV